MSFLQADLSFSPGIEQSPSNVFKSVYDKYGGAIYGLIHNATDLDKGLAEKLAQEVFIEYYNKKNNYVFEDRPVFTVLIKILIRVMEKNGFRICSSLNSGRLSFTRQI